MAKITDIDITTYDFSKLTENPRYADTIEFWYCDTDENGNRVMHYKKNGKPAGHAVLHPDTHYAPLLKTTMKVAIDKDTKPWCFMYPNQFSHPLPAKEEAPAEVLVLRNLILK